MTDLFIKFTLLVWPFGHFLSARVGESSIIPLLDILALATLLSSLPKILRSKKIITKDALFRPIIVFLAISALSLLIRIPELGIAEILKSSLYLLRLVAYFCLYFTFRVYPVRKYLDYVKLAALLFVVFGMIQYLFSPNMSFIQYIGFDDHFYRLIGTLLDPNYTGALLSAFSVLFLAQNQFKLSLAILIPLAFTFSRASYLSFLIPALIFSITKKKYLLFVLPIFLALAIFIAPKPFGEGVNLFRTFSITSRLGSVQQGLSLFAHRPILGWGYNTLTSESGRVGIDNSFIFLLATTGLAGLVSFLYLLREAFWRKSPAIKLSVLSILVHSLFNNTIFLPWVLSYLILLMVIDEI